MEIALTGATGFIGSYLVDFFVGLKCHCIVN
jgi:thioester reductase-like protein